MHKSDKKMAAVRWGECCVDTILHWNMKLENVFFFSLSLSPLFLLSFSSLSIRQGGNQN